MRIITFLLFMASLLLPLSTLAESGLSCHCFQDRAYNPDRPGAADAYVLATTRNSFISALFDIPKQQIVKARMSGTPGEDLWLAGYLASRTGQSAARLLEARHGATDWSAVLVTLDGFPESLDPEVARPLLGRQPIAKVISVLTDFLVSKHFGLTTAEVAGLRATGARDEEVILLALLSGQSGIPVDQLNRQQRQPGVPWDMFLERLGLEPKQLDALLRNMVGQKRS